MPSPRVVALSAAAALALSLGVGGVAFASGGDEDSLRKCADFKLQKDAQIELKAGLVELDTEWGGPKNGIACDKPAKKKHDDGDDDDDKDKKDEKKKDDDEDCTCEDDDKDKKDDKDDKDHSKKKDSDDKDDDKDDDDKGGQVKVHPKGGVDTGGWSLEFVTA